MNLKRLYIENFMCHECSYIDFSQFSSALIIGKAENNDLYSNGVGKTTIFKAIEYVLFNQADLNLDKLIRDEASSCKITLDFFISEKEYRLIRTRTKKGTTDVSLLERNSITDNLLEAYHSSSNYPGIFIPVTNDKYWKDLSGRRAVDTEKDLSKLLKINFKSFRSTVHFLQNDFSGLTSATPEKRKGILKEALNLVIYSKLEKIAKDKSNILSKDIEKHKTLIESLGEPDQDLINLNNQLLKIENILQEKNNDMSTVSNDLSVKNESLNTLNNKLSSLQSNFSQFIEKENILNLDISKLETTIKDLSNKKSNIVKSANQLLVEVKSLKEEQVKLESIDYSELDVLSEKINNSKDSLIKENACIQTHLLKIEELKIPFPADAKCKNCRQSLSEEHKKNCLIEINNDLKESQNIIANCKKKISNINNQLSNDQQLVNKLNLSKKNLESINDKISFKNKELKDKKVLHQEYTLLLNSAQQELNLKKEELNTVIEKINDSSKEEADKIDNMIKLEKENIVTLNSKINLLNKEMTSINNTKAIINHNIEQKNKDKQNKNDLQNSLSLLHQKYDMYPSVLQAFSSTGIPNLIIQNVLDDLQIEANNLLNTLKPSLQLSFTIEKTKSDGTESDTLDILYYLNGKERQYEQLSGAQKLAVTFSLKLGLSFLLQKMIGTNIKFLLLDEIDQSLDKASVDAFAEIVRFFQKDFTILIITHNDRLKDKFKHIVLVEQDANMVSRAQVLNN